MPLNIYLFSTGQTNFTNSQLKDVLCLIDFRKLSETVLEQCKLCKSIPQEFITEAALALCERLRTELNKHKSSNSKLNETKPPYQDVYSSYKLKYPKYNCKKMFNPQGKNPRETGISHSYVLFLKQHIVCHHWNCKRHHTNLLLNNGNSIQDEYSKTTKN